MKPSVSGCDDAVWHQSDAFHNPPFMLYTDGPEEQEKVADEETGYVNENENADGDDTGFEFEFSLPAMEDKSPTMSADEIFHNGQIRPLFPVFGAEYWRSDVREGFLQTSDLNSNSNSERTKSIRVQLRKLMLNSEQDTTSCSSSEADDLESASPETYCVWVPPKQEMSKKSKSTGSSSKRWKLRNLVHRSHSDGRDSLVSLTPKQKQQQRQHNQKSPAREKLAAGKAHREHYVKNREMREKDRNKSYLPYRQDVVGLFANVNGLGRTVHPF